MKARTRPKLKEIAEAAEVSIPTVDRVLNKRAPVSEKTRKKVLAAFEQVNLEHLNDLQGNVNTNLLNFDLIVESGRSFNKSIEQAVISVSQIFSDKNVIIRKSLHESIDGNSLSNLIKEVSNNTHGLILICPERPTVSATIDQVISQGTPVVCLTTDLPDTLRLGYVGINQVSAGCTAASIMGRFIGDREGDVVLVGGAPFRNQEEREMGFRRVIREEFPKLNIREKLISDNKSKTTYKQLRQHFECNEKPLGIYNASGGNQGIADAIAELDNCHHSGIQSFDRIVFIGHELNDSSYSLLTSNQMDAVIHHDIYTEVLCAVNMLLNHFDRAIFDQSVASFRPIVVLRDNAKAVFARYNYGSILHEVATKLIKHQWR